MTDERRSGTRHLACIAALVSTYQGEPHLNVIRELSTQGAQLLSRLHPVVGAELELRLYVHHDRPDDAQEVTCRVVRVESRDSASLWPYLVAVQFKQPLVGLDAEIASIAARQAEIYGDTPDR